MTSNFLILSATNRPGNKTFGIAELCKNTLTSKGLNPSLFSLQDLPENFSFQHIYNHDDSLLQPIVEKFIQSADKIVFVVPEYNGSYPGILKVFIDAIPPRYFKGKKALLIGTSSGRAGNLRGMDHLTGVLHYIKMEVFSQKLPVSSIEGLLSDDGQVEDQATISLIEALIEDFIQF